MLEELPISVYIKQNISITCLVIQSKVKIPQVCSILYNLLVSMSKKKDLKSRLKHSFHSLVVTYGDILLTNDDLSEFISIQEDYISKVRCKLYIELTIPYFTKS